MTPAFVADAFGGRVTDAILTGEAGYVSRNDGWWRPSGRQLHDPAWFYEQNGWLDPFGQQWALGHDPHHLAVTSVSDPLGNQTQTELNSRVLQPYWVTDANGNRSGVRFDELGMVVATAVIGKPGAGEGDFQPVRRETFATGRALRPILDSVIRRLLERSQSPQGQTAGRRMLTAQG